jgi:hypothetical protein
MTDHIGMLIILALILAGLVGYVICDMRWRGTDLFTDNELKDTQIKNLKKQLKRYHRKREPNGRFAA